MSSKSKKILTSILVVSCAFNSLALNVYATGENVAVENAQEDRVVEIKDANLKKAINTKFKAIDPNRNLEQDIKLSEMQKITRLGDEFTSLYGIKDLSGLEYATNLKLLNLNENFDIEDISPLKNLVNLEILYLGSTKVTDISALSNLTNLVDLNLAGKYIEEGSDEQKSVIKDITPLKNLTKLNILSLANRGLTDISALSNLKSLTEVYLSENEISNIEVVSNFVNIETLDLSYNKNIVDITPISKLENLYFLSLFSNKIEDISPLKDLVGLNTLFLQDNAISDISPLEQLTNLKKLYLSANKITDVTSLQNLTKLTSLRITDNFISDLTPISKLEKLTDLNLSNNSVYDLSKIGNLEKIKRNRGFAKQLVEIEVKNREFELPKSLDFDGSEIALSKNEDGTITMYETKLSKGKLQPVTVDEELKPIATSGGIEFKDGKYILPEGLNNQVVAIQWFKNYQQWGSFILKIKIQEAVTPEKHTKVPDNFPVEEPLPEYVITEKSSKNDVKNTNVHIIPKTAISGNIRTMIYLFALSVISLVSLKFLDKDN